MEKRQIKQKNIALKLLPRAASAVFLQNHYPFSPSRDHRSKRCSGPIVSIVPEEVRRQKGQEDDIEPTSPKVSCIGQIKQKKKENIKNNKNRAAGWLPDNNNIKKEEVKLKKDPSTLRRLFRRSKSDACSSTTSVLVSDHKVKVPPSLGEMKRLASGRREGFKSFDWTTAQIAPVDVKGYYSDDDQMGAESDQEEDEEKEVIIIPFSAPITVGGGGGWRSMELKPRKEVNLWKRRTMNPPGPLRLD